MHFMAMIRPVDCRNHTTEDRTMRTFYSALIFVLLCSSSFGQTTPPVKPKIGPRLVCETKGWDFGVVSQGTQGKKVVTIKNEGDAVLNILDIKVTCGCVHALMPDKVIPPGESRDLILTLTTFRAFGIIQKHCYVYSNDGKTKRPLVLSIKGEVKADWWPETRQIQFGRVEAGQPQVKTFKIFSRITQPLVIESITCRNPNIKVEYKLSSPKAQLKQEYLVTVTLLETQAPGNFAAAIAIRVKHRQTPLQNVMIYGRLEGDLKVWPLKVFVGRIFYDRQVQKTVKVSLPEGYSVLTAKGSTESMKTEIRPMPDGMSWEIDIYVTGLESEQNMDESMEILTDNSVQPRIVVPVTWVSRPQRK